MKLLKKLTKKKKRIVIIVIILLILGIKIFSKSGNITENQIETENIERRSIAQSVAATGTLATTNTKDITSTLTGSEIASVNVVEGQKISAGDVICTFDMSNVETNLSDAKSTANISSQQANLGIESAQRNLNDAMTTRDNQIISAQKEVESASQAYQNAQNQLNSINTQISTKQAELDSINTNIAQIQAMIASIPITTTPTQETDSTYTELNNQLLALQQQVQTLTVEIAQLQATLPDANQTVSQLKSALDIAIATLNTTTTTADSNLAAMQDNLKNAQLNAVASNQNQNSQIKAYEEQLEKGVVTSTVSGTVTSVNVKPGDIYTGANIAKIEGIEEFIVESEIDEYYISDIKVGMRVLIKTDATRDEELSGRVIYTAVSPTSNSLATGTTTSGNTTYTVKIALDSQNDRLRLGMNAKISIILDSKDNVWTVPYDSIYEREDGTHYIEILKNEETEEKEELDVTPGIEGTYYVEIISDKLKDGMKVVLPQKEASNSIEDLIQTMGADAGM